MEDNFIKSNRLVMHLDNGGKSSWKKGINKVYMYSNLVNEFIVRLVDDATAENVKPVNLAPDEFVFASFEKSGATPLRNISLVKREITRANSIAEYSDDFATTEFDDGVGYEYYIQLPTAVLAVDGEWTVSVAVKQVDSESEVSLPIFTSEPLRFTVQKTLSIDGELVIVTAETVEALLERAVEAVHQSEENAESASESAESASQSAETASEASATAVQSATSASESASSASASAISAQASADNAEDSAESAQNNAENSEAWAVGTKNGTPVSPTAPQYQNNAKYYAEIAREFGEHEGYYSKIKKITDYAYEASYVTLNYRYAVERLQESAPVNYGACSSVRNGNMYGRNFDWKYDESATFVVRTPHIGGRYASTSIARLDSLTNSFVQSGLYSDDYVLLPFLAVDGINEKGVVANVNVVPLDRGDNEWVTPSGSVEETLSANMLVRYILDNFDSATTAVNYIAQHCKIYTSTKLIELGFNLHFMVADSEKTYCIEFINNDIVVKDISNKAFITNFHLDQVTFNEDGTVYTPETQTSGFDAIRTNNVEQHGQGLERYNLINNYDGDTSTLDGMGGLMYALMYTNTYMTATNPYWHTEFTGGDLFVNSPVGDFASVEATAQDEFSRRTRNGATWQTVHSAIYDIDEKTLNVVFQEGSTVYTFNLDSGSGIAEIEYSDTTPETDGIGSAGVSEFVSRGDHQHPTDTSRASVVELAAEVTRATTRESELAGGITTVSDALNDFIETIDTAINKNVVKALEVTQSGDVVNISATLVNIQTGVESTLTARIPLANSMNAGAMSPADVRAIANLTTRVSALENVNIHLLYTEELHPTPAEIEQFVRNEGYTDTSLWTNITVDVLGITNVWRYYDTQHGWVEQVPSVNQATNTTLGIVKGSQDDGKVYAENDGTMSVNGWDDLQGVILDMQNDIYAEEQRAIGVENGLDSRVTANETDISSLGGRLTNAESDIDDIGEEVDSLGTTVAQQGNRLDTMQGTINGLQSSKQDVISTSNMLDSDLVRDTNNSHKFVTASEKAQISTNATNIANEVSNRTTAVNNEATARANADLAIKTIGVWYEEV